MYLATDSDTLEFAQNFAKSLRFGDIVALHGDLGAGKTSFVKGVVSILSPHNLVQSPTFTYLNIYEGEIPIYHFDLYRIKDEKIFIQMGFLDYLSDKEGICLIEWPKKISDLLPNETKHLKFEHIETGGRHVAF